MNTYDNLQQALKGLNQAIVSAQQDVKELERMVAARDQEEKQRLNELKRNEAQRLREAAEVDSDQQTASRLQDARMLREEESHVEDEFNRQKQELDNYIALKRRHIDGISRMAQQVQQMASQINTPNPFF